MLFFYFLLPIIVFSVDVVDISGAASCPDTTKFIKKLLAFKKKLDPVPLGLIIKYRPVCHRRRLDNGTVQNTCARGELECSLSRFQVCAQKYIAADDALPTIGCIQGVRSLSAAEACTQNAPSIKTCAYSSEGNALLTEAQKTRPTGVSWVPWIVINGVRVAEAEHKPKKYICRLKSLKGNKACR
ncbi:unnamed protein product [Caenorhabditis sp. 36 PRJEB53466]|nr:unnamed protein product [Caenorhabditis sp. 36 PRJEB53466]